MLELKLMMMGIPKLEINTMTSQEIQVLTQLLLHMNREEHGDEA